ncbi:MAG: ATP-binding protein [Gammaproteobacteria bacterium]|nr:ATP-binding protein [Gammaproteobacteria bacterium]
MTTADQFFARAEALLARLERLVPETSPPPLEDGVAWRWRRHNGVGRLKAIRHFNAVSMDDLQHIDFQRDELDRNTRQFLAGLPANNALLWGPRGTGKSSLVKALFNRYVDAGLRVVEVDRNDLVDLPEIVELLAGRPGHYIVFCDDLSFDEHDSTYRALKTVLDGSISATPGNMLIYATSNRRHLVPERLSDNQDARWVEGEVHQSEAVEEKISLSERFGLWLSFHPYNQDRYLDIVTHWLGAFGIDPAQDPECERAALQWALLHGSRSGRSAFQFAKDWAGRRAVEGAARP